MGEGGLEHDKYADQCPICLEIVENEVWPRTLECGGSIDDHEVRRGEKSPPCPVCDNDELLLNWLTMPTKANRGFVHNMILHCPSCGTGMSHMGTDAVTGKPLLRGLWPEDFDRRQLLLIKGFFRVRNMPCLDDGWDAMGHGVAPIDRSDIMQRFYEWTNDEALGLADSDDNPLRERKKKRGKKRKWW